MINTNRYLLRVHGMLFVMCLECPKMQIFELEVH